MSISVNSPAYDFCKNKQARSGLAIDKKGSRN